MCNVRVVGRHTDPRLFDAAAEYLRKGTGLFVPKKTRPTAARRRRRVRV